MGVSWFALDRPSRVAVNSPNKPYGDEEKLGKQKREGNHVSPEELPEPSFEKNKYFYS